MPPRQDEDAPAPARDVADYIREAAAGMAAMAQDAGLRTLADVLIEARQLAAVAVETLDCDQAGEGPRKR